MLLLQEWWQLVTAMYLVLHLVLMKLTQSLQDMLCLCRCWRRRHLPYVGALVCMPTPYLYEVACDGALMNMLAPMPMCGRMCRQATGVAMASSC